MARGSHHATEKSGVIMAVRPVDDQFVGHIFLWPKKDRSQRPVFNLRPLNRYNQYHHFKMEGLPLLKSLIQRNDWMVKVDLKDAYFCVTIHQEQQKFLRFQWEGTLYQFCCLPFGLASTKRDFTTLLKPVTGFLRRLWICLLIYQDDILVLNQNKHALLSYAKSLCVLLESLGFVINRKKSGFFAGTGNGVSRGPGKCQRDDHELASVQDRKNSKQLLKADSGDDSVGQAVGPGNWGAIINHASSEGSTHALQPIADAPLQSTGAQQVLREHCYAFGSMQGRATMVAATPAGCKQKDPNLSSTRSSDGDGCQQPRMERQDDQWSRTERTLVHAG